MARTSIEQKAIEKAETIGRLIGISQTNVIGCLILLWNRSQDQGLEIVDRQWIDRMVLHSVRRKSIKDAFVSQLVAMRILDDEANMTYRIKGNKKHIEGLKTFKSQTKKAREMKKLKGRNRLREVEKVIHIPVEIPSNDKLWLHNWDGIDEFVLEEAIKVFSDDTTFGVFEGHNEVIHNTDGKALPVADSQNKTKHVEFKKTSVNRTVDGVVDSVQLQVQMQPCVSSPPSSSLNFFKKEKEEKLIEASTNFVYEEKTSAIDEHFDNACQKYREKFEHRVDWKINAGQNAKLRYSQLIKSGVSHDQVLAMINNYADAKFLRYPSRDGFFSIHHTFERFLGFPGDWHCRKYLTPIIIADRSKLERNAQSKVRADLEEEARLERVAKRKADRLFRLGHNVEWKKVINDRIENEKRMKQEAQNERKSANLSGTDFKTPGDILNGMNFKL